MGTQDSRLRAFFNHITDFLFILDQNGNIIETNNAVHSILGYSNKELAGKSVLAVHPPEFREQALEIVQGMLAGKLESCPIPLLTKNNTYIPVETKIYPGKWKKKDVIIGLSRNQSDLALSEAKFREVFDNCLALMAISEIETGRIIDVNREFLKTLGYSAEEVMNKTAKELNLYEDYSLREDVVRKLTDHEKVENKELVMVSKTGEKLICQVTVSKILIQTHGYLLISCNNVNQLKLTERKLKHNLKQQTLLADIASLLNSNKDFFNKIDETLWLLGRHADVSRVYIFEDDRENKTTSNTHEWCNKDIVPQKDILQNVPLPGSWTSLLENNGKIECSDIRELDDELFHALELQSVRSLLAFPLYVEERLFGSIGFDICTFNKKWEQDEVELLRAISNIISAEFEKAEIQKKLKESEAQLKMAIENTETGLWDWNIQTGYVFYNDVWCQMLGYKKSELEPNVSTWAKLVHPDDMPTVNEVLEAHMAGKTEYYQTTHRLLTKSGKWKWVIDKGKVIERDSDGKPLRAIGTHTDIDTQKEIESELRLANATKDKFFSIIAHDLRGPIGTMTQIAEMLYGNINMDKDILYTYLTSQKEISKSTFQLLDNLLNWANFNRDQIKYNPTLVSLSKTVNEILKYLEYQSSSKKINVSATISEKTKVFADEDMVKLIMRNLLTNAIKFTPEKGTVKISAEEKDGIAVIEISDTGVGISGTDIPIILSDDTYLSTYGTNNEKGSGLGLKLCKNFIHLNKGDLEIKSEKNKGTTFSFTLPLNKEAAH